MIKIAKKQKGFTLVELLIVIAIIAVLAAVIAPVAVGALEKSKATAVVANVKSFQTAELTYYATEAKLPSDTQLEMNIKLESAADKTNAFKANGVEYKYTKGVLSFTVDNSKLTDLLKEAGFVDGDAVTAGYQIELNPGIPKK
ncbi:type II secretion system protein [Proteiniclasticum sediminis]|nr:type II secretion system protein [Proteiniclasticum sediminis]